jgi:hypothetical protein
MAEAAPPTKSPVVYPHLGDEAGMREQAVFARVRSASSTAPAGEALHLPSIEFVEIPVAERARRMLQLADILRVS